MEGAVAIAEAVRAAGPAVVAAYPITPQTHVVEALAQAAAAGTLRGEVMTVESEHSAASAVLGASAAGVRTFTATSSQGLLYMSEVVFNIAGLRLPVVMTVANRAISGPLSIWNDHQDSMALRDAGWIQLYAQTPQEAHDLHLVAFRVAEDPRVSLPVMVCVDGFVLTHAYEPVETVPAEVAAAFLPPYRPERALDPSDPRTMGTYAEPWVYTEARYAMDRALRGAATVIAEALADFSTLTGRTYAPGLDWYRCADADVILVAMGTAAQTARDVADDLRLEGVAAGVVALRTFRPFPSDDLRVALRGARRVVVVDRAVSLGAGGIVAGEVRDALAGTPGAPPVAGVIAGLGGRDLSPAILRTAFLTTKDAWIDVDADLAKGET